MSVTHDDFSALGVQIFWSRKNKYPCQDDSEGVFNAVLDEANDPRFPHYFFQIAPFGEKQFANDNIFLGIYQYSGSIGIQLEIACSFGAKTAWSTLKKRQHLMSEAQKLTEKGKAACKLKTTAYATAKEAQEQAQLELEALETHENEGQLMG